jgi:hypothetical protein
MNTRRQRRFLEKSLKLKKTAASNFSSWTEIIKRKIAAGKQIHLQNLQDRENQRIEAENQFYTDFITSAIESGMSEDDAKKAWYDNQEVLDKRLNKKS